MCADEAALMCADVAAVMCADEAALGTDRWHSWGCTVNQCKQCMCLVDILPEPEARDVVVFWLHLHVLNIVFALPCLCGQYLLGCKRVKHPKSALFAASEDTPMY